MQLSCALVTNVDSPELVAEADRVGYAVPSLRTTNAAAIASLAEIAPGPAAVAVGSGFTGRYPLGQRPLRWAFVEDY